MINKCYISEDVLVNLAMIFLMAGFVILIPVSVFTTFFPLKRTDMQTGKLHYLPYLMGIAFFCMTLAGGMVIDIILFQHCPSIGSSALIVLVSLAVGIFSKGRFRRLLFDIVRSNEFRAKLKDIKENKNSLSHQEGFPSQGILDKRNRSKGILVFMAMNLVQTAIVGVAGYLLIVGLPWFNQWVSVVLALLLLAVSYVSHYYLKRRNKAFIDKFLEERNS